MNYFSLDQQFIGAADKKNSSLTNTAQSLIFQAEWDCTVTELVCIAVLHFLEDDRSKSNY